MEQHTLPDSALRVLEFQLRSLVLEFQLRSFTETSGYCACDAIMKNYFVAPVNVSFLMEGYYLKMEQFDFLMGRFQSRLVNRFLNEPLRKVCLKSKYSPSKLLI